MYQQWKLRVLCTVTGSHGYTQSVSIITFNKYVICLCILAPENLVSIATNKCVLLFYTLLLKLKLVSHFLSNRHEIFTQATFIVLLWFPIFDIYFRCWTYSGIVSLNEHIQLNLHTSQHLKLISKIGNRSFLAKLSK